ncbi:MAG: hypothetical protein ACSLE9_07810 [Burkholderiaceae bacterium]
MNPEYIVTAGSAHRDGLWVIRYTVTALYGPTRVTELASASFDDTVDYLRAACEGMSTADATRLIVEADRAFDIRAARDREAIEHLRAANALRGLR